MAAQQNDLKHDDQLINHMRKALNRITNTEIGWIFERPVNYEKFPDYADIIEKPMHLSAMRAKIETGDYETLDEFCSDFRLIVKNCIAYFAEDTLFVKAALQLNKEGAKILKQMREQARRTMIRNLAMSVGDTSTLQKEDREAIKAPKIRIRRALLKTQVVTGEEVELDHEKKGCDTNNIKWSHSKESRRCRGSLRISSSTLCNSCIPLDTYIYQPFSDMDFVSEVHKRPALWDRRLDEYKDNYLKRALWCEVGSILNFNDAKEKWNLLLNKFRSYHKELSRQFPNLNDLEATNDEMLDNLISNLRGRRPWPLFTRMRFMLPFMQTYVF